MQVRGQYADLLSKIGYSFKNEDLLTTALTHRSAGNDHNERLEFLGDAVLGQIIAKALFDRFPHTPEGQLTRMRASLVKGETLGEIAIEFDLGPKLLLGPGELKSGGQRRVSILADAVEAIIGAVFLDSNLESAEKMVLSWYTKRLARLDPEIHPKDNKTRLQEYIQSRRLPLPEYNVDKITGKSHQQTFFVSCKVSFLDKPVIAKGSSRRKAEQQAALNVLEKINNG